MASAPSDIWDRILRKPLSATHMNQPLCVVHIASGDLWAGAEVQLYHLATELHRSQGLHLHVVLLNHGVLENRLRHTGVNVTVFSESQHSSLGIWLRLVRFLRKVRPQIIHTHRGKENVLGALASLLVRRVALVQTVHGSAEFIARPWQVHKNLYAYLNTLCTHYLYDRIVAVSAPLAFDLAGRYSPARVIHIDNGISVDEIRAQGAHPTVLPGSTQRIKIGIIGRLVHVKRVDVFLLIAKSLSDSAPNRYAFYIFGDGPLHADLRQQAMALGIDEQTHFMGFTDEVIPSLARLDMLLITSDHEGLPMVLLEALSLSVPVVAPAVGGIPELLQNGQLGTLIILNEHIDKYREAISDYARDPVPFHKKAAVGLEAVYTRYSAHACADKYQNMYRMLSRAV